MKANKLNQIRNGERGSALLIVLFALLLASAIAFGMIFASNADTATNMNYRDEQRAYYAARAGLEEARQRLQPGANNQIVPPASMPNTLTNDGVIYITNPLGAEAIDPTTVANAFVDSELCRENFTGLTFGNPTCSGMPTGNWATLTPSIMPNSGQSDALLYKWVRITNKTNLSSAPFAVNPAVDGSGNLINPTGQVCWDGTHENAITAGTCATQSPIAMTPVWVLTSMAVTPSGSRRIAQMEVANEPPISANAAVDSQAAVKLQGKLDINAYDHCNCDASGNNLPGKVCDKSKWAVYTSGDLNTSGNAMTITSGQTSGTPPGTSANAPWPFDVPALIDKYKNMPDTVTACATDCKLVGGNFGATNGDFTPAPKPDNMKPQVTYFGGNTQLNGAVGSGILIIDGDLDLHGGLAFYGLILVKGTVDFTGGANDNVNTYGAFLNGKDIQATNIDSLGGSVVIQYDSCALNSYKTNRPPTTISSREMSF
jgi:hypothetical protein